MVVGGLLRCKFGGFGCFGGSNAVMVVLVFSSRHSK